MNNSETTVMKPLTLTELNKAIAKFSANKMAPKGLLHLIVARNYFLGQHDVLPEKDPREVLVAMGWKW